MRGEQGWSAFHSSDGFPIVRCFRRKAWRRTELKINSPESILYDSSDTLKTARKTVGRTLASMLNQKPCLVPYGQEVLITTAKGKDSSRHRCRVRHKLVVLDALVDPQAADKTMY